MAYKLYLDGVLFPVAPSKVTVKINNQNETVTLINEGEAVGDYFKGQQLVVNSRA